jgi:hypothetical protein
VFDDAKIDDIFDDGGTISVWVNPSSDGENNGGRLWDKTANSTKGHAGYVMGESGGKMNFVFNQIFSTTSGSWNTPVSLPIDKWTNITVTYNNSNVANNPVIYFNGVAQTLGETTPVGTRVTDDGENLRIGNRTMTNVNFDGSVSEFRVYNIVLTATEAKELYSGASVPFKYKGANQTEMITDTGFENWSSSTNATNWVEYTEGSSCV